MVDNAVTLFGRWAEGRWNTFDEQGRRKYAMKDVLSSPPPRTERGSDYDESYPLYQDD
jgi:hypothetical protein